MFWSDEVRLSLGRFRSEVLQNERRVWVQPPARGADTPGAGLAVFLDGEYYLTHIAAPTAIRALQLEESLPPLWSIYVAAGAQSRRWPESFCNEDFAAFLCDELVPWMVEDTEATAERLLIGVSLTGLSAAHAALCRPGIFQRVLCHSGSFWWDRCWLPRQLATYPRSETQFRLTVGSDETKTDVDHGAGLIQVDSQQTGCAQMRDALRAQGFSATLHTYEGGHDMASWRRELPDDLRALCA